ncbi:LysR-family transcriptional regulator YidZ [Raoultella terrigena]|uniref:HTH-type transcriptional regulator YidZ n=1 Tax=Raoultella terrigena TaxID=577 RepID=UPI001161F390|nr:HTH-type transcriptional regulator YidZ [Raoultella terrigena]VUC90526.1 LysR-family transcriptional regulator YidZ [Raoultella terrigena]
MKKPLSSLDLNLLLCLQLLTQELSVTRTAKRMNVSPSAVSKSLAKLRAWFDDPLFVKTPLGLTPTPLMTSMEQDLADWMQMGNQILDKPHHATPSGLKFELAAEMPLMMILFDTLARQIYQRYPQALIRLRGWDYDSLDTIIRGEVDIGFCGRETHPRSREQLSQLPWYIDFEVLFTDLPQVWLRADHPALSEEWNLETFLRYPHINISWEQIDTWALDDVLQDLGHKRTVALTLPGFEQSLFMAAQPDHHMLATAPRYCHHYNRQHQLPLVSRPLPLEPQLLEKVRVPFVLLWHKRNSYNPKIVWLREALKRLYTDPL